VADPHGPRKDYVALAERLDADVLDRSQVRHSRVARLIARLFGIGSALAWLAFRRRRQYGAFLTDGEHIGIPLALLLKFVRADIPHVMIGHRISASKKRPLFRWLRVHTQIDRIALHSKRQFEIGVTELGIPAEQLSVIPFQADADFWQPQAVPEERLICSAGLEYRDYPVLIRAVDGLDVQLVIGASSHWSRRRNTACTTAPPPNVHVASYDYRALRDLYARSSIVVVPLDDVDFQAGVTTILEAMAMGKAVIVTATQGQSDVLEDRRAVVRGVSPRPVSLLRDLAKRQGIRLEPNGFYVPPGDATALRRAIVYLLDHPEERARLGMAGRHTAERMLTVDKFAERTSELVDQALADRPKRVGLGVGSRRLAGRTRLAREWRKYRTTRSVVPDRRGILHPISSSTRR
jgi:glycosyltransferase involved in cell wall biosynthesis